MGKNCSICMTTWKMINYQCTGCTWLNLNRGGDRWWGGRQWWWLGFKRTTVVLRLNLEKKLADMALTPGDDAGGQVGRVWCICPSSMPKNCRSPLLPRRIPGKLPSHRDYINRFTHICQLSITNVWSVTVAI